MKYLIITLLVLLSSLGESQAQSRESISIENDYTDHQKTIQPEQYSEAQLAQILAPIALYPDTLLTHILIAATYPIELVQAQRWLDEHAGLSPESLAEKIDQALDNNDWDASVIALMAFPEVLQKLSDDLDWVQELGDAFLNDETQVLASIQQLRKQAQQAGSLGQMTNSTVSYEGNNIIIEPAQAQIIYVPYYDSRAVYGSWRWTSYPPVYWSIPDHYYSGHYVSHYNWPHQQRFYWHSAVHIRHHFFFGAFNWHNRHVVVINNHGKSHNSHYRYKRSPYTSRTKIVSSTGAKRWQHKPVHRRGVAYRNKHANKRFSTKQRHAKRTKSTEQYRRVNKTTQVKSAKHSQPTYKKNSEYQKRIKYQLNNQPNKTVKHSVRSTSQYPSIQQAKRVQKNQSKDKHQYHKQQSKNGNESKTIQYSKSNETEHKSTRKSIAKAPVKSPRQSRSNQNSRIASTKATNNRKAVSQKERYKRER